MSRFNLHLGKLFNIPIYIHWTWWLFLAIQAVFSYELLPVMVVMFGIVLLHELGHCLAARYFDFRVDSITLHILGGLALVDGDRRQTPKEEFWIIACGPLVNLVLAFPLYFLGEHSEFVAKLFILNLIMLVFNLLPVFPLDGSKIGRSILSAITRNERFATKTFAYFSKAFAVLLGLFALLAPLMNIHAPFLAWLLVIAVIIWIASDQELSRMPPLRKVYTIPTPTQESLDILHSVQSEMTEYRRKHRNSQ